MLDPRSAATVATSPPTSQAMAGNACHAFPEILGFRQSCANTNLKILIATPMEVTNGTARPKIGAVIRFQKELRRKNDGTVQRRKCQIVQSCTNLKILIATPMRALTRRTIVGASAHIRQLSFDTIGLHYRRILARSLFSLTDFYATI